MAGSRHLRILIPAAGGSQRFRDAGYATPKPWLRLVSGGANTSMLDLIGEEISVLQKHLSGSGVDSDVLVGCPLGYVPPFGVPIQIEKTLGQADTIRQLCAAGKNDTDMQVLVVNSDVVHPAKMLERLVDRLAVFDMSLLVHTSRDPSLSYINMFPQPTAYAEKQVISSYGISGAWGFSSRNNLARILHNICSSAAAGREVYLSHVLGEFTPAAAVLTRRSLFVDLGTPAAVADAGFRIAEYQR